MDFSGVSSSLNISQVSGYAISGDILAVLLVLGLLVLYSAWRGRGALVALLVSLYISLALFQNLPIKVTGGGSLMQTFLLESSILFGVAVIIHLFIYQMVSLDDWAEGMHKFVVPSVLALATTGLIFAVLINVLEIGRVYEFSYYMARLFTPDLFFWWLFAPVIGLVFASRG